MNCVVGDVIRVTNNTSFKGLHAVILDKATINGTWLCEALEAFETVDTAPKFWYDKGQHLVLKDNDIIPIR